MKNHQSNSEVHWYVFWTTVAQRNKIYQTLIMWKILGLINLVLVLKQ